MRRLPWSRVLRRSPQISTKAPTYIGNDLNADREIFMNLILFAGGGGGRKEGLMRPQGRSSIAHCCYLSKVASSERAEGNKEMEEAQDRVDAVCRRLRDLRTVLRRTFAGLWDITQHAREGEEDKGGLQK
ncbi:hypothetical protein BSKO_12197 [Bryopsis sp. KO-2023]|nr:hypothetical protein BSKO_12197 [Bryopsis sp. KO-2023]